MAEAAVNFRQEIPTLKQVIMRRRKKRERYLVECLAAVEPLLLLHLVQPITTRVQKKQADNKRSTTGHGRRKSEKRCQVYRPVFAIVE